MRYLPLSEQDKKEMLTDIGVSKAEDLFKDIPCQNNGTVKPFAAKDEIALSREFKEIADKNTASEDVPCFLGAGAYRHYFPAAAEYLLSRGEFLTSYTPYQPEISQGTLQIMFEYQTQVARLTGLDVANASMYDSATAAFEAAVMACRITGKKKVMISGGVHPDIAEVVATCTQFGQIETFIGSAKEALSGKEIISPDNDCACVMVQIPDFFGNIRDLTALAEQCHKAGALFIVVFTEPLALALLKSLADMGADIAVGEGLGLAGHLNFGGSGLGLFACRKEFMRNMPGRLVGETTDTDGKRGFVLTMATREQHIRREKATSNICTNSGLNAAAFSMHLAWLGEKGFKDLAHLNHLKALELASRLESVEGVKIINKTFFNEFTVCLEGQSAKAAVLRMAEQGILAGVALSDFYENMEEYMLIAATEMNTDEDIDALIRGL
jgi:glycine dehydrogenase subunit 1